MFVSVKSFDVGIQALGASIETKDNQSRFDVAQTYREHLKQVYADRGLEEWLQVGRALFHDLLLRDLEHIQPNKKSNLTRPNPHYRTRKHHWESTWLLRSSFKQKRKIV